MHTWPGCSRLAPVGRSGAGTGLPGGVRACLFYLFGYCLASAGLFAVLVYLSGPKGRQVEHIDDLTGCAPGFGSELTADRHVVDVRGRYHPGWCAPRLVASTAEEITQVFDALIAGDLLKNGGAPSTTPEVVSEEESIPGTHVPG